MARQAYPKRDEVNAVPSRCQRKETETHKL